MCYKPPATNTTRDAIVQMWFKYMIILENVSWCAVELRYVDECSLCFVPHISIHEGRLNSRHTPLKDVLQLNSTTKCILQNTVWVNICLTQPEHHNLQEGGFVAGPWLQTALVLAWCSKGLYNPNTSNDCSFSVDADGCQNQSDHNWSPRAECVCGWRWWGEMNRQIHKRQKPFLHFDWLHESLMAMM